MLKKLTEEQQARLIDTAILEFADKGFKGAGLSRIAKKAGVSVGVIYKYYEDKDALFNACVKNTLDYLDCGGNIFSVGVRYYLDVLFGIFLSRNFQEIEEFYDVFEASIGHPDEKDRLW